MPAKNFHRSALQVSLPRKFYHRSLSDKGLNLIQDLEVEVIDFKRMFADGGIIGFSSKKEFFAILENAARAFGAFKAETLAEFTGVSASTITKIRKGHFPTESTIQKIADTILDACRFYLDKSVGSNLPPGWIAVPKTAKDCIFELSSLLDAVLVTARGGNEKSDLVLTAIERAELIAILETALLLLKAPLVDRNFLGKLKDLLFRTSKKAAEKQIELGLSAAAGAAGIAIANLVAKYLP